MTKLRLSICMIVKDEENNLPRCLNSIKLLIERHDVELIIVDTGSTDNTVHIATQYTEKVYYHEWNNNFSDMRNISISYAKGEWIFILDADEEIEDVNKLINLIQADDLKNYNTIVIQARNFLTNDTDTFVVNKTERLFRNKGFKYEGSVHNQPIFQKPVLFVSNVWINHYGYNNDDVNLMEKKFKRTSTLLKKELEKDPKNIYYHFQLARTYAMHKDHLLSLDEIREAYKLIKKSNNELIAKKYIYVFNEYSRISFELNLFEETIKACKEGIALNPNYIDLYYYLGKSLENIHADEEAYNVFKDYLKLYLKYSEGFDDPNILEQYKLDINSQHEIKFRTAQIQQSLGESNNALELLKDVKNNQPKILLMTKILLEIKNYEELFEYYLSLETMQEKNIIRGFVEDKIRSDKSSSLITIFSKDDSIYGLLNQLRTCKNTLDINKLLKSSFNKYEVESNIETYSEMFKIAIENNSQIVSELKKINNSVSIKKLVYSLINSSEKYLSYFMDYLSKSTIRKNDFQSIRVYIAVANTVLLHYAENNQEIFSHDILDIFKKYLTNGNAYLIFKYGEEKINYLYRFEKDSEEKFFMLMSLYLWNSQEKDLKYLKEASSCYPYLSKFVLNLINENKVDLQKSEVINTFETIKESQQNLKILHGTMEIAGQMNTLVKGLNQLDNITAMGIDYYPSYLSYGNIHTVDLNKTQDKERLTTELFEAALNTFDVFHFHFNTSLKQDLSDLPLLKESNKKIFMHNWGTDVRLLSIAKGLNPNAKTKNENELAIKQYIEYLANYIDHCIVADAELYEYVKGFYNNVHFVRQALDINQYLPQPNFEFRKTKPVIVHAPTSTDFKGTKTIHAVIEKLKLKYDFEYRLVQNLSHEEAKEVYRDADIIIDQLYSVGHGMLALEAMAMEKPVITSISEFMANYYPKEIPIISANPNNLEKKVEQLLKDFEMRQALGKQGRMYVEKYHDHRKIAKDLFKIYTS